MPLFLGSFLPPVLQAPGLCACSALVPGTGTRLAALSPLNAGPAAIAVALVLPDELVRPGGCATLTFTTENEVTDETLTEANPFNSQSDETAGVVVPLNARARCNRIATKGVPRVTASQRALSAPGSRPTPTASTAALPSALQPAFSNPPFRPMRSLRATSDSHQTRLSSRSCGI